MKTYVWLNAVQYLISPITWGMFIFGLLIGSFLNVCIFRIPEKTFWKHARSICPHCQSPIPIYHNIPVLSYLILLGKASCCGARLSIQYPIVEFLTGLIFVFLYWHTPFILRYESGWEVDYFNLIRFIHATLFSCLLLICSVIDLRHMIIPDLISLSMIGATPIVVYLHPDLDWKSALIGVIAGGLSLYLVAWLYWLFRREVGLGMGDVKLMAAVGGWLGYQAILPTIFLGSIIGAVVGIIAIVMIKSLNLKSAIPFGPFLALGAFIHLVFGEYFQEWLFIASQAQ